MTNTIFPKNILIIASILSVLQLALVSAQSEQCNSCCQGPSGIPGVPGNNGNNGLPGRDGIKGEHGFKGEPGIGLKGESGLGLKGDSGDLGPPGPQGLQGSPGKVGPRGRDGVSGVISQTGPAGEKGSKGEKQVIRQSAFSVFKTSRQTLSSNEVLTFEIIESNIGNNFDSSNNKFTCQIPGTYFFTFTIGSNSDTDDPYVLLVRDNSVIAGVAIRDRDSTGDMMHATQSAVIQLDTGNQVWLKSGDAGTVHSDSCKCTSFSGFLLYS